MIWRAEAVVDERLARTLVAQLRGLDGLPVSLLSTGWDRTVYRVGDDWVFGFPRRAVVVPGLEREIEWLPRLAPLLPRPISVPVHVGRPSGLFGWPFVGSAFLPGVEAPSAGLDDGARRAVGVELASFLRALHAPELAEALDASRLPPDVNARADMRRRVPYTRERFAELRSLELWRAPATADRVLAAAERLPDSPEVETIAHGDLHVRHLLVRDGRLSGIIDWVDVCRGDPAIDLMLYWSFVPPAGRADFLSAYGGASEETLLRARVVALFIGAVLAVYAHAEGLEALRRETLAGLDRALLD